MGKTGSLALVLVDALPFQDGLICVTFLEHSGQPQTVRWLVQPATCKMVWGLVIEGVCDEAIVLQFVTVTQDTLSLGGDPAEESWCEYTLCLSLSVLWQLTCSPVPRQRWCVVAHSIGWRENCFTKCHLQVSLWIWNLPRAFVREHLCLRAPDPVF